MTPRTSPALILAAGGILSRTAPDGEQILIVHRKRHGDCTLPKGKVKSGEALEQTALREVKEETGHVAALGEFLGTIAYSVEQRPKIVFFWRMEAVEEHPPEDHEEVESVEWVSVPAALERLTHPAERALVARLTPAPKRAYASPGGLDLPPYRRRWSWSKGERAYARLLREFEAFRVELAFRVQRSAASDMSWSEAARDQLANVARYIERKDVDGAWHCLHGAQRLTAFGLSPAELEDQALLLGAEAGKLSSWRAAASKDLLRAKPVTAEHVYAAMELRDGYAENQYQKIGLMADQLAVVLWISLAALALFLVCLVRMPAAYSPSDYRIICTALLAGVLGAAFSTAQSLISHSNPAKIPERVASHFATIIRSLFGSTAGLMGYLFLQSKIVGIKIGDDGPAGALAIAFLFGYAGERLIARVVDTISKDSGK